MRICVIGGSGFLGSHVADQLSANGHDVVIYDRKMSPWLQSNQLMCVGDLLAFELLREVVKDCEVVYNFAALADLNDALGKPIETVKTNILGNVNVLEACRLQGVKRFIYASTVYVYSREGGFYRCSKQASEHYVEEYQQVYGLDYTILRYGSLYGPRTDESNGLYRIVKTALEKGILRYEGSSESLREYIHVEDAARASVVAINDDFRNQSVILTGQEQMRVHDLMEMLAEILGLKNSIEFTHCEQPGHYVRTPYAYQPKLGRKYVPAMHVDLGQGLLQLIEAVRNNNSGKNLTPDTW
jgi:UDP-glucose 4-epimerase